METDTQRRGYLKILQVCLEVSEEDHETGQVCYTVTRL
jgi:hypothetical protein